MIYSPDGALASKMLPHLEGLKGVIAIKKSAGRAPMDSGLDDKYIERLKKMVDDDIAIKDFYSIDEFKSTMDELINTSDPIMPNLYQENA